MQVAEPEAAMQPTPGSFADMQLVQTGMEHPLEENPSNPLQQYGSYVVIDHPINPAEDPHVHEVCLGADGTNVAAPQHANSITQPGAIRWYGNFDVGNSHAGPGSNADSHAAQLWNAQQAMQSHYSAAAEKAGPGDVPRRDTPTSVFDIFSSLCIVPGSPQYQHTEHNSGKHLSTNGLLLLCTQFHKDILKSACKSDCCAYCCFASVSCVRGVAERLSNVGLLKLKWLCLLH